MGHDQINHFLDQLHVGSLLKALGDHPKTILTRQSLNGITGFLRREINAVSHRIESGRIGEIGKFYLTCRHEFCLAIELHQYRTIGLDENALGIARQLDHAAEQMPVRGGQISALGDLKTAVAGITERAIGQHDLEEAGTANGQVQWGVCLFQIPNGEDLACRGDCRPDTDSMGIFRIADQTVGPRHIAIQQVFEIHSVLLEARGIYIGQVIGNDINVELLGMHARCADI